MVISSTHASYRYFLTLEFDPNVKKWECWPSIHEVYSSLQRELGRKRFMANSFQKNTIRPPVNVRGSQLWYFPRGRHGTWTGPLGCHTKNIALFCAPQCHSQFFISIEKFQRGTWTSSLIPNSVSIFFEAIHAGCRKSGTPKISNVILNFVYQLKSSEEEPKHQA